MKAEMETNSGSHILENFLWETMDLLRAEIDLSEIFNYILPLIFFKYVSETYEHTTRGNTIFDIPEKATWASLIGCVEPSGKKINTILSELENSVPYMKGLFSDIDYDRLHHYIGDYLIEVIKRMDQIQFSKIPDFPNAFDNMFDWMADSIGYRGGEFRTPRMVSKLLVRLASPASGMTVCDPACGSGGLLIAAQDYVKQNDLTSKTVRLFGQERNITTWVNCKMNLLLHGLVDSRIEIGDTLIAPGLIENRQLLKFDRVVSNPPMSLRSWGQEYAQFDKFDRFRYGIPPKSSGDFAFLQHAIATLSGSGKAIMVMAHGPLFRGGPEQKIREALIKEDIIECIISMPPKLLYGTSIPCVILILNKAKPKKRHGKVLFINAKDRGRKVRSQTYLREADLDWIVRSYQSFTQSKGFVRVVNMDEIVHQNFSLDSARFLEGVQTHVAIRPSSAPISGKEFEQWIEELPYPLASILWSYTSTIDPEQKTNSLLHFFEALSQFNTTLMLSAITKDKEYFEQYFSKEITKDVFTKSSFGGWVLVGTRLASKLRKLMKREDTRQRCIDIFGKVDECIVDLLTDEELGKILSESSELRNTWKGHSGAVTKAEYSKRLTNLEMLLTNTRRIVKNRYSSMILVLPGIVERYQNEIFFNIVKELRGTRTPFREIRLESNSPMESESLHFIADGGNIPIKLLPFLRIMHSPVTEKNACYFYNRVEPTGIRWITYQFQEESELTLPDEDVEAAIEMLYPSETD